MSATGHSSATTRMSRVRSDLTLGIATEGKGMIVPSRWPKCDPCMLAAPRRCVDAQSSARFPSGRNLRYGHRFCFVLTIGEYSMRPKAKGEKYDGPAGGWGSLNAVVHILTQEEVAILGSEILLQQNKPGGFMCVSCSWAKPAKPHPFEFCENGAKATAWEITGKTVTPEFFSQHTLTELRGWSDHQLEEQGRLTTPMRYDPVADKYVAVDWQQAFEEIGAELKKIDPRNVIFYTSGRASLEASYMS